LKVPVSIPVGYPTRLKARVLVCPSSRATPPYFFAPGDRFSVPGLGKQEPGNAGAPGAAGPTEAKHFVVRGVGRGSVEPPLAAAAGADFIIVAAPMKSISVRDEKSVYGGNVNVPLNPPAAIPAAHITLGVGVPAVVFTVATITVSLTVPCPDTSSVPPGGKKIGFADFQVSLTTACFDATALPADNAIPIAIARASTVWVEIFIVPPIGPGVETEPPG
jgi:hypothetical protein